MLELHPARDALFLDIDGTLLDIAPTPDSVVVPHSLLDNLTQLYSKMGGALALISGRSLQNVDRLFIPLRLPAAGSHGAEWRISPKQGVETGKALPEALRQAIILAFSHYPEVILEDKHYSMAVHYRKAPELADTVSQKLNELVSAAQLPLRIMQGKMVCEVLAGTHGKGAALERFMMLPPFIGRRPIFLGDDVTDLDAMETCIKLGGIAGQVGQCSPQFETWFTSPDNVRNWIRSQL